MNRPNAWLFITLLIGGLAGMGLVGWMSRPPRQTTEAVAAPCPAFSLTDQFGQPYSERDLMGKQTVVAFFFTACPSLCPRQTEQMKRINKAIQGRADRQIVYLSLWPEHDTSERLRAYGADVGTSTQWHLLTGRRETIYALARHWLIRTGTDADSLPVHEGIFILLDPESKAVGYYNSTDPRQVEQLIEKVQEIQ